MRDQIPEERRQMSGVRRIMNIPTVGLSVQGKVIRREGNIIKEARVDSVSIMLPKKRGFKYWWRKPLLRGWQALIGFIVAACIGGYIRHWLVSTY